jgi:hypothetical protein
MSKKRRPPAEPKDWSGWHPVRIGDLHKLFRRRYGDQYEFPDDDAGREDLRVLVDHYSLACPSVIPKVLKERAPWLTGIERDDFLQEVTRHPRFWPSRELAIKLNLAEAERGRLKIQTIAAVDVTDEERTQMRKTSNAELQRAKRRAQGAKSRDERLASSKSRTKPWLALGLGRSVYYAKLKAGRLPGPGQVRQQTGQVRQQTGQEERQQTGQERQQSSLRSGDGPVRTNKLEGREGTARVRCSPWAVPEPEGSARGEAEVAGLTT